MSSNFLNPGSSTSPESFAILHLRRDHYLPVVLKCKADGEDEVIHTRFGSFPHNTLLNIPWGSQVAASKVDARGRAAKHSKKRRREAHRSDDSEEGTVEGTNYFTAKGFLYVLPPTPESWTVSLPHRTQVVYTPDYSYVLQRLQVRPGTTIIEAGAGSGSFTHAAARAVFNGRPVDPRYHEQNRSSKPRWKQNYGHVYSFEYHKNRVARLAYELKQHGLDDIVTMTHQDVYKNGFSLPSCEDNSSTSSKIRAEAVFLDLPAPWYKFT